MKKLLVPTDFSEPAHWALSYAVNIAQKANAEIKLLHVKAKDSFLEGMAGDLEKNNSHETQKKHFKKALEKLSEQFKNLETQNIAIEFILAKGNTSKEVAKICQQQNIDLLITAANGKSDWQAKLFGSVAEQIMKKVSCPVLVLPPKSIFKPIKQITFATDLSDLAQKSIAQIHNLAEIFEAQFNFVHIIVEEKRSFAQQLAKFRLMADEAIGHEFYEIHQLHAQGVIEGLNQYAHQNPIDILAMLRHQRSSLNKLFTISYAETMTAHAEVPILVFSE